MMRRLALPPQSPSSCYHSDMTNKNVLISGAGIAGLTLGILLKEKGWEPTVIERDPAMRREGYMIDFFSTGWDVAERMGLVDELRKITYPIDALQYVDRNGKPYLSLPVTSVRKALAGKYTYLLRTDLERILFERTQSHGLSVKFGTTIQSLRDNASGVTAALSDGSEQSFALVFGADGVHSRVRELAFGPETRFDRFLGYYVAAFQVEHHDYGVGTALTIYEEPNRSLWVYSLGANRLSAVYVFRHKDIGFVPADKRVVDAQGNVSGRRVDSRKDPERRFQHGADLFRQRDADRDAVVEQGALCSPRRRVRVPYATCRAGVAYGYGGSLCARAGTGTPRRRLPLRFRGLRENTEARDHQEAARCGADFKIFCAITTILCATTTALPKDVLQQSPHQVRA